MQLSHESIIVPMHTPLGSKLKINIVKGIQNITILVKLIKTWMAKALQPYACFPIENNRVNFYRDRFFPIDSMLTDKGQESVMLSEM